MVSSLRTPSPRRTILLGALMYLPKGWSMRGTAAYDGIGGDYEAVSGKVWLNIPLN